MSRKKKTQQEPEAQIYPDLNQAIFILEERLKNISKERHPLLKKWIEHLNKIQKEIFHLQKLEKFTKTLTRKEKENDQNN